MVNKNVSIELNKLCNTYLNIITPIILNYIKIIKHPAKELNTIQTENNKKYITCSYDNN